MNSGVRFCVKCNAQVFPGDGHECKGPPLIDEVVNHPPHYGGDTQYEVIKVIEAWKLDFHLGNVVKYVARAGKKAPVGGLLAQPFALQDLKKAQWYLERKIKELQQ